MDIAYALKICNSLPWICIHYWETFEHFSFFHSDLIYHRKRIHNSFNKNHLNLVGMHLHEKLAIMWAFLEENIKISKSNKRLPPRPLGIIFTGL